MADYSPTTDFAAKDNLESGDAAKVIQGADIQTELNGIATAIATKSDNDPVNTNTYGAVADVGTPASGDEVLLFDVSGNLVGKTTVAALTSGVGSVADTRTISAGTGLTGGGDLSADRVLALDTANSRNVDHAGVTISAGAGLTGGGDLTANRTLSVGQGEGIIVGANSVSLDVNSLSTVSSLAEAADFLLAYDASASSHVKILLQDLFAITAAADGSIKLGNILINWGTETVTNDLTAAVSFPTTFGATPYGVVAQHNVDNTNSGQSPSCFSISSTGFTLRNPGVTGALFWIAIGPA